MTASSLPSSSAGPARPAGRPLAGLSRAGLSFLRYVRRNPSLGVGLTLLLGLLLFCVIGGLTYDTSRADTLSVMPSQPPSAQIPLGSDQQGRDLMAVLIVGTPMTLRIGVVAGFLGVAIGTILAFVAAYYGGVVDAVIRGIVDVGLTVPGLLILIIVAVSIQGGLSVDQMGLVIATTAWLWPARTMRSQVLTLRERRYVELARLSGCSSVEIIVKELMPNLLPYIGASLVTSVSAGILSSIGLEALGLGPMTSPTLGMTVYWVIYYSALLRGEWWWWAPPIVAILIVFVGFFLVSAGLDELSNPRLRRMA